VGDYGRLRYATEVLAQTLVRDRRRRQSTLSDSMGVCGDSERLGWMAAIVVEMSAPKRKNFCWTAAVGDTT
jgi:hypothetical protein